MLITGGTGIVGRGVARAFLEAGAVVVVNGSSPERTEAARAELARPGGHIDAHAADLADPAAIAAMFEAVERRHGTVAVLVNGAGINFNRRMAATSPDDFDRVIGVNVKAAFFASRLACDRMVAQKIAGRIVNITSGNYRYVRPDAALYAASKAALEMLTRGLALEYGAHGIAVNAVAPGLVERAGSTDPGYLAVAEYYIAHSTQRRLVRPQDVAETVLFLASERAAAMGGETIVVDGGFSAGRLDFPRRPG